MSRAISIVVLVGGLSACAPVERTEPPAPIVTAGTPETQMQTRPAAPPPPPQDEVEVYAYRPPGSTGDGTASGVAAADGGATTAEPRSTGSASAASPSPSSQSSPPVVVAYAPPAPPVPSLPPAVDALVTQAEQQRRAKDYVSAAATLERALGIRPQESYIWNRLARVRTDQGLYSQAANLAKRSNVLAGDQAALKQDNWSMIAVARRASGDTAGALEAERKARGE